MQSSPLSTLESAPAAVSLTARIAGVAILIVALGAGAWLRLAGIGRYGFWTDELFHVFAASSWLRDGTLSVPWEAHPYTRALPVTMLTALSFKLFAQSEASARLPFALANLIFIVIATRTIAGLFSKRVALIFAIASSFSILSIEMSRECRMYTLFQLFYFVMAMAFYRSLESGRVARPLALAFGAGAIAMWLQPLAANLGIVLAVYCAMLLLVDRRSGQAVRSARSKYALMLGALVILVATAVTTYLVLPADHPLMKSFLDAVIAPAWNHRTESHFGFYLRVLVQSHPIMLALYPLGAFFAIYRYGRLGLYVVLSFLVLFVMHCFVFGRVSERYIFYVVPFLVLVGAIGADAVLSGALALGNAATMPQRWRRGLFYAAITLSSAFILYPRLEATVADTSVAHFYNWKDLDPRLVRLVEDSPSVTTERMTFNYYFGGYPTYVIDSGAAGGERVLASRPEFEQALARHPNLVLVTYDQEFFSDAFVARDIRQSILEHMTRVDHEADSRIMVFRASPGAVR